METVDRNPQKLFIYECRGPAFPINEPSDEGFLGIWPEPPFYYLFYDRESRSSVRQWLGGQPGGWLARDDYQLDYDQWQQSFSGDCRIGPFVIRTGPDLVDVSEADGASKVDDAVHEKLIRLNPGVVFGSGLHASTRGCLLAIAALFEKFPVGSVVDLGTGTGILALACASLGAARVLAIDCNPLAVRVARRNVLGNRREEAVKLIVAGDLGALKVRSDLLLMNLEWPCLKQVVKGVDWLGYQWVILSGFLNSQWKQLEGMLPPDSRVVFWEVLDDWVTVAVHNDHAALS